MKVFVYALGHRAARGFGEDGLSPAAGLSSARSAVGCGVARGALAHTGATLDEGWLLTAGHALDIALDAAAQAGEGAP